DHTHQTVAVNQRITGERNHSFAPGPFLIANARVIDNVVGQVRRLFLGDQPDLEFAHGYAGVRAVNVSVHSRAGLEFEHLLSFVEQPDSRESRVEIRDDGFGAFLQALPQRDVVVREYLADIGPQRGLAAAPLPGSLLAFALADVAGDTLDGEGAAIFIYQARIDFDRQTAAVFADDLDLIRNGVGSVRHPVDHRLANRFQVFRGDYLGEVHLQNVIPLVPCDPFSGQVQ